MLSLVLSLHLVFSAAGPSTTFADQPFDSAASANVYFSSLENTDTVTAAVRGKTCTDAMFTLSVVSHTGTEIHRHEVELDGFMPCIIFAEHPESMKNTPIHIVNSAIHVVPARRYTCKSPEPPGLSGCWEHPEFRRFRELPALCYSVYTEKSRCVVFDPTTQKVIEVYKRSY